MSNLNFGTPPNCVPAFIPSSVPSANIARERLVDAVLENPQRLRLLCAPAGFGKTHLIKTCLNQLPASHRIVWISMAGQSLTLPQFCERVGQALGIEDGNCKDAHQLLQLLNAEPETLWLVLDDYPHHACPEFEALIDLLLKQASNSVQMVVSSRHRPTWNLTRLLLEGQLFELDARQLAFTQEELMSLITLLAPQMPVASRERLWRQTFGWCAGARLMLSDQHHSVLSLTFTSPWLGEYLEHELLSRLGEVERAMLYGLAHLPKFSSELCARLLPGDYDTQAFQSLFRSQPFFLPLDQEGRWFCLLPAVANALQGRLHEAELNRLRLSACAILNDCGQLDDAIELALCAGQPDAAASYMDRLDLDWLVTEQHLKKLLVWRDNMPAPLLESTPRLIFQSARALLYSWRLDEAQMCIERLGSFLPQKDQKKNTRLLANWQVLQGSLEAMRGNANAAIEHCQAALSMLCAHDWQAVIFCHSTLARVFMATGQWREAQQLLCVAVEKARRHGCVASEMLINTDRIRQAILRGDFVQAESLLHESFELAQSTEVRHILLLGRLQFLQGELLLLRGAVDACQGIFEVGISHALECADPFVLHGYLGLCEASASRGDFEQASLHLHEAERRMHCANVHSDCYQVVLEQTRLRLLVRQNCWEPGLLLAQSIDDRVGGQSNYLPPLHTPSLPQRIQLLWALAEHGVGQITAARTRLHALLERCEQLQFAVIANEAELALTRFDAALGTSCSSPTNENGPMTSREHAVLQLLAQGLTNNEIGSCLFISVNTVKAHTKNINAKLGVSRRAQAVMQAKALGILS